MDGGKLVVANLPPPALLAASPSLALPASDGLTSSNTFRSDLGLVLSDRGQYAGVQPAGRHFLHFVSFEIGRGPDGNWWVLSDRTQAPSGAGFALENRVATTRAFSDVYAETHAHRLAGFFGAFRSTLQAGKAAEDRIAVLTPGLANETYFEHAYIARYLGFMLLEGEDLTVVGGKVMVRTVAG